MWWSTFGSLLLAVTLSLYLFLKKRYSYFKDRGIKYRPPAPFLGSMWRSMLFRKHFLDDISDAYKSFPGEKYFGIFEGFKPVLVIRDPEIVKKVTVKDFDHFVDHRSVFIDAAGEDSLFTKALIMLKGQKWRNMRGALSPAFTGSKMKLMIPFMTDVGEQVVEYINVAAKRNGNITPPMELYKLFTRIANDVIASCAFGMKVDSLRDEENQFYTMGKNVTNFKRFTFFMTTLFPKLSKMLGIRLFAKDGEDFFRNLVSGTMKHREQNNIIRHDMIHLLMDAKKGNLQHITQKDDAMGFATVEEATTTTTIRQWTDDELAAQAFIFFFAGFETTSTALTFVVHEITLNNDVQEKLRAEIDRCHAEHDEITYDVIQGLKYMDMVLSEGLRKWASAVLLDRECAKDYTFEPPHEGGKPFTMKAKQYLYIYVTAIHADEKYYPSPNKFDPERFSDDNKHNIKPFTYLPFGSGPRNCIGSRFALMELKVMLYHLLLNFELLPCEKTTNPMTLAKSLKLAVHGGSWITFKPRHRN